MFVCRVIELFLLHTLSLFHSNRVSYSFINAVKIKVQVSRLFVMRIKCQERYIEMLVVRLRYSPDVQYKYIHKKMKGKVTGTGTGGGIIYKYYLYVYTAGEISVKCVNINIFPIRLLT